MWSEQHGGGIHGGGPERGRGLGEPGGTRAGENGLRMAGRDGHDGPVAWFLSDNLPEYSATVGGLLSRRPAQHTILPGAIETLRAAGTAAFGAVAPLRLVAGTGRRGQRGVPGQAARDAGASRVLLFTDLANPTSNGLYQRLGYEPVEDRAIWSFRRSPAEGDAAWAGR